MDTISPPQQHSRVLFVDFLRGLGIIIIVLIHSLRFFTRGSAVAFQIWNYLHFVVPLIVVVSGASLALSGTGKVGSPASVWQWIKKRTARLLVPYYFFLVIWFAIQMLAAAPAQYPDILIGIETSALLFGNVGGVALTRLILALSLFFPLLMMFYRRQKIGFLLIITSCFFFISLLIDRFFVEIPDTMMTVVAWLVPFSAGLGFAYFLSKWGSPHRLLKYLAGLGAILAVFLIVAMRWSGDSLATLVIFNHEYPPDVLFFLYGGFAVAWLVALAILLEDAFQRRDWLRKTISYFSSNSFEIFIYHYLALYVAAPVFQRFGWFSAPLMWIPYFLIVLGLAIVFGAVGKKMLGVLLRV